MVVFTFVIKEIKDLTPVRGQDGKISDTQGKNFWSPTRHRRVGDRIIKQLFPALAVNIIIDINDFIDTMTFCQT